MFIRPTFFNAMILALTFFNLPAFAERPHEKRSDADYVLEGFVTEVYQKAGASTQKYIIELRVSKIIKGEKIKQGELFWAFCFQSPKVQSFFGAAGHRSVPVAGSTVRIFVNKRAGLNEGVYPKWVDILKDPAEENNGVHPSSRAIKRKGISDGSK